MEKSTFLSQLAERIVTDYSESISDLVVILPNKRAKIFLIESLRSKISNTVFAPEINSIEDFVQEIAGIRSIDSVELLFEFYAVYKTNTNTSKQEPFETFANWAITLLQDFNEIDRYLLASNKVFTYLEAIKEVEHWSVEKNRTPLIEKHLAFWKLLPKYYENLYDHLNKKGIGYQGLIYREAVENLQQFSNKIGKKHYIFAGFNALNKAEEKIFQYLLSAGKAEVFWDIDNVFLSDKQHDAGLFVRDFKNNWPYYKSNPFSWIADDYQKTKNIHIIGTPKSVGQAKIVGEIIQKNTDSQALSNTAIVLGEESLLLPVLFSLPADVDTLNITMGYSSKNNPAQILVSKLFKMHANALKRNQKQYVFYYKEVLDVLTNPLIAPYSETHNLVQLIKSNNFTFINHKKIIELASSKNKVFSLIFQKWDTNSIDVLDCISSLLLQIKSELNLDSNDEKITKAFVYSIYKIINKLKTYYSKNQTIDDLQTLEAIYKQVVNVAEVSFEGEPLNGLQIMGVLESRVLDFETVIITSLNEGKFPAGKSTNSFIPYDVKKEYGLPTFKEKDAIYTFHFYHLLQRAKNVYLLYNTESEGIDGGEKSRFITQLLVEKQECHTITEQIYNADVPATANFPTQIPKSEMVMQRLKQIATENGFSPSSLTNYIRNPLQFYFQRVLRISDVDEVEENIAVNTLGIIIHKTLEILYLPFVGKTSLTIENIKNCISKIDAEVLLQFKEIYKEGEIKRGQNLLAFEIAKRTIFNFLNLEMKAIENGDNIKILALEKKCKQILKHPALPYDIAIQGTVDRIENRNGILRIIDYKTGKVEDKNLKLTTWADLTLEIKNDKIIQILCYAFMLQSEYGHTDMEAGIISFKNLNAGFLPFTFVDNKVKTTIISKEILDSFTDEIVVVLNQILDQAIDFQEH